MGDANFLKYYVCAYNKWNPFSDEVKRIPDFYWLMQFQMIRIELKTKWEEFLRPTAELTGSIANPEAYKFYREYHDKMEEQKKKGGSVDVKIGTSRHAIANSHYDPAKGLVDDNGHVLIPKERFDKMIGMNGIAVSY